MRKSQVTVLVVVASGIISIFVPHPWVGAFIVTVAVFYGLSIASRGDAHGRLFWFTIAALLMVHLALVVFLVERGLLSGVPSMLAVALLELPIMLATLQKVKQTVEDRPAEKKNGVS